MLMDRSAHHLLGGDHGKSLGCGSLPEHLKINFRDLPVRADNSAGYVSTHRSGLVMTALQLLQEPQFALPCLGQHQPALQRIAAARSAKAVAVLGPSAYAEASELPRAGLLPARSSHTGLFESATRLAFLDSAMKFVQVNGLKFAYHEEGTGQMVLLLHGFPDNAATWSYQFPALAAAGYRVVAPYLRGYHPTEVPQGGFYDKATLASDVAALIETLGGGRPVHLVGQDWGAIIAYAVLAAYPDLVRRAVVMAVPHPAVVAASMLDPKHVHRSFHWWFFQLPDLPEKALAKDDYAFIDYLWTYWTSPGHQDTAHIRQIKNMLAQPGVLSATLAYYRAMLDPEKGDPRLAELRQRMQQPIRVPTLALCGSDDLREELMLDQGRHFAGEYQYRSVASAGHFLHREEPEQVTRLIVEWLGEQ